MRFGVSSHCHKNEKNEKKEKTRKKKNKCKISTEVTRKGVLPMSFDKSHGL